MNIKKVKKINKSNVKHNKMMGSTPLTYEPLETIDLNKIRSITIKDKNEVFVKKAKKYLECFGERKYDELPVFDEINYIFDFFVRQGITKGIEYYYDCFEFKIDLIDIKLPEQGIYLRDYPELQFIINKIICINNKKENSINLLNCIINKNEMNLREFRDICELYLDLQNLIDCKINDIININRIDEFLKRIEKDLDYNINKDYGKLIAFEGCDSVGKDYIINNLKLDKKKFYFTREPGGPEISEHIRNMLLDNKYKNNMSYRTEVLLYAASRAQHVEEVIIPKLQSGIHVITNRYYHSSIIYQSKRKNVNVDDIININKFAIHNYYSPDLTLSFYVDNDTLTNRLNNKVNKDRLEQESNNFFIQINENYKDLESNRSINNMNIYDKEKIISIEYNENEIDKIMKDIHKYIAVVCSDGSIMIND